MNISAYRENFAETQINWDTREWDLDYFLMFDDSTSGTHIIEVTNNGDAQTIHVGAHVW